MKTDFGQIELARPPVVETALSVQFVDLPGWSALHHGLYYPQVRNRFSEYSQIPETALAVEAFPTIPRLARLQFTSQADAGCAQFKSASGTSLIRIQRNRFAYHWMRMEDGTYPRYSKNCSVMESEFDVFGRYCAAAGVGTIAPVMCEAMYLNQIAPDEGESISSLVARVFGATMGDFELITLNRTFSFENRARVYSEINVEFEDSKPLIKFQLTSRVIHNVNQHSMMTTMNNAHDWLIDVFKRVTTESVRKERWGEQ